MKQKISLEDVLRNLKERKRFNKPALHNIEWYYKGKPVIVSENDITDWKFTGLSNIDFARCLAVRKNKVTTEKIENRK
jgi:hypothetical protein